MDKIKSTENMTFESALSELEEIVQKLDTGQESLESSISSFERGVILKKYCEQKLQEAKLKIEKITKPGSGEIVTEEVSFPSE